MADFETNASECTLLATILDGDFKETALLITTQVADSDFLDSRNREIYKGIVSLLNKNQSCDFLNVINELRNLKTLDLAGGEEYITYIKDKFITGNNVTSAIHAVLDRSLLNQFANKLKNISDSCAQDSITNVSEFIASSEAQILEISKKRRINDYVKMDEVTGNIISHLVGLSETRKNRDKSIARYVEGIPTGYEELDKITLGWKKGDYVVIGARPSVGKTSFGLNLAYNVCKKGIPVLFLSLEMDEVRVGQRLLSKISSLSSLQINNFDVEKSSTKKEVHIDCHGDIDLQNQVNQLNIAIKELSNLDFYLDCNSGVGILDVVSKIKKFKTSVPNLGLVVIDYLTLIRAPNNGGKENRNQEVAVISNKLQRLSRDLEIPIIALTQVNREADRSTNHKPQMSDIRESGSIEQDADIVIMLYRPDYYDKDDETNKDDNPISTVEALIRKNRNGRTGKVVFTFNKPLSSFCVQASDDKNPN